MKVEEARDLIARAIPDPGGVWADLGAGGGTFTRALAELLGPTGRVYAVDRDKRAVATLDTLSESRAREFAAPVVPLVGDLMAPHEIPELAGIALDGVVVANALHFVADAEAALARIASLLRDGGRIVVVEYDRRAGSRWVPYPIPPDGLAALAARAGLTPPTIVATRPSMYAGTLYAAYMTKSLSGVPQALRDAVHRRA